MGVLSGYGGVTESLYAYHPHDFHHSCPVLVNYIYLKTHTTCFYSKKKKSRVNLTNAINVLALTKTIACIKNKKKRLSCPRRIPYTTWTNLNRFVFRCTSTPDKRNYPRTRVVTHTKYSTTTKKCLIILHCFYSGDLLLEIRPSNI